MPNKPIEKSFEELVEVMGKHYMGQRNPRPERFEFKSLVRAEGESIQTFAVRLRETARHEGLLATRTATPTPTAKKNSKALIT